MQEVARAPSGAHDVLRDVALRAVPLQVVVMAAEHDPCVPGEPVPQRVEVGRVTVCALAVAGAMPEGDAAVALRAGERALEPGDLR